MASINQLKSTIARRSGLTKGNRFAVYFTPPQSSLIRLNIQSSLIRIASGNFNVRSIINDPRDTAVLCESVDLPGRIFDTINTTEQNVEWKIANQYTLEDVKMTFIMTQDYYIRRLFDDWMDSMIDFKKHRAGYLKDYSTDITIQHLNERDLPLYAVKLINAYPLSISPTTLSSSEASYTKLDVSFAYGNYIREGEIQSALGSVGSILNIARTI